MKKTIIESKKWNSYYQLLAFSLALGILAGCSSGSVNQKLGSDQAKTGNYEEAIKYFEASRAEGNDRDELRLQLAEAKYQQAHDTYEKIEASIDKKDLPNIIAALSKAKQYTQEAIDEVKVIKDKDIKESDKKLGEKNSLLEQIVKSLETKNLERTNLVAKVDELKEMAKKKVENAFLEFIPLLPYKDYLSEISEAYSEVSNLLINELNTMGLAALDTFKTNVAKGHFEKAKKYFPEITKGQEGLLAIDAVSFHKEKKFKDAYAVLGEIKKINPENAYLLKNIVVIRDGLLASEIKALASIVKTKTNQSYLKAIDGYRFLLQVEGISKEQNDAYNAEIKKIRGAVAGNLIKKAKDIAKEKDSLPLVWTILKNAWRFDPEQAQAQNGLIREAYEYIQKKSALNSMIVVRSNGDQAQAISQNSPVELENHVKQQIVTGSLQLTSWPVGVKLVHASDVLPIDYLYSLKKPQDLSRKPSSGGEKMNDFDVILWANVLENKIEEYGNNQVIYKVSRFVSSTRMVDNPEWFTAQQELASAEQSYNSSYQQMQTLINQCDGMGNAFAVGLCKGAVQGISTQGVDSAREKFNATPRYLQENVNSDYNYRYYRVGINLSMKIELQYIDLTNKINAPLKILEYVIRNKE
ncbi:MAG: hypothetical protein AABY86_13670 [Bdellovibrionota bacterium]